MADLQHLPYADTAAFGEPDEPPPAEAPTPAAFDLERARVLLAAQLVVDGHNTLGQQLDHTHWQDLLYGSATLDTDLPRIQAGGVGAQFWSLHTAADTAPDVVSATLDRIDAVTTLIASVPEVLRLVTDADQMAEARDCGRIASILGPVAGAALADSLGTLRAYHALGVRSVTVAGAHWTATGLTAFGESALREMNRLGVLVDLSGATEETMDRALSIAAAPVILSRSAARALTDHPDNVTDAVLRRLRANRGVCMVSFAPDQVRHADQPASLWDVADHVEHVRALAGPESVGLAGSYGTASDAPHTIGLEDASCYPNLIAELLHRDWSEADIAALTWGNAARVMREAQSPPTAG
ncbi:peptidase M19 [Streptomyces solincola]|uniref:Peptidase M19 n=1 Tax=Streptomyces solincola TaxID=2100817 RepID=A0A2S9PY02_9ACTN|nr:dipeptidase [Streptomyces solincola]PRH79301.1 peptidase M19 [Streptomyces solincola]